MKQTDNITCKKCLGSGLVPNPKTIGRRLKRLREKAGVSLTAVKKAMNVSHGYISLMESGKATITTARVCQYREAVARLADAKIKQRLKIAVTRGWKSAAARLAKKGTK